MNMNTNLNAEAILDGSISQSKLDVNLNTLLNDIVTSDQVRTMIDTAITQTLNTEV